MPHVRFNPMIVGAIANVLSLVGVPLNERAARDQEKMMGMTSSDSDGHDGEADVDMVTAIENTAATTAAKCLAPLADSSIWSIYSSSISSSSSCSK